jgi:hypothetical protein
MARLASSAPTGAAAALVAALQSRGFETGDFQLEESRSSDLSDMLGIVGGILRVRCCSTGEERIYSTGGSGSAWLGAFLMDLGRGHFSRAARHEGSGFLPLSRPAVRRVYA